MCIKETSSIERIRFPIIPLDNEMLYKFLLSVFSGLSLILVYIQIYKTIWWLPQSHTQYAINFHLIDYTLFFYFLLNLIEPFIIELLQVYKSYNKYILTYKIFTAYILLHLYFDYSKLQILFVIYPIVLKYLLINDNLVVMDVSNQPKIDKCKETNMNNYKFIKHKTLKVLYLTLINAVLFTYYSSFLPFALSPSIVNFNVIDVIILSIFLLNSNLMHAIYHYIPYSTIQNIYQACQSLPSFKLNLLNIDLKDENNDPSNNQPIKTKEDQLLNSYFYQLFSGPTNYVTVMTLWAFISIILQLLTMCFHRHWNIVLSLSLISFYNHYLLFKIVREYFILTHFYNSFLPTQQVLLDDIESSHSSHPKS